jgi:hypothetical protein
MFTNININAEFYTIELVQTFPGEGCVSDAGDVNGDGFEDIIVGMKSKNNTGEVFIYFGGEFVDNIADVHLKGETMGDQFGYAVSSAGDVNRDGFCDIIIGAPQYDYIAEDTGRAYIFLGGDPMDNTPDIILNGEYIEDYFGSAVAPVYDVNNDTYDDLIIGAYSYGESVNLDMGKVYLLFGNESMDNIVDITITGREGERLGASLSSAGDINNDGYFDIIIGATGDINNDPGWAYVFFGGNPMNNITDINFTGEGVGDGFGIVSSAGDFNNDGYHDIIIGAPNNASNGPNSGKAYLYLGGNQMNNITDKIWIGENDANLGRAICNASDINNDGFDDIIIGAYENDKSPGDSIGAIYIYYGNISLTNLKEHIIYGYESFRAFGISVSAGDFNQDNYSDILVGSRDLSYLFKVNIAPSLTIYEPNGIADLADRSYIISWLDDDPDDNATITLYYCVELSESPILIQGASELSEDDENDMFIWDTTNISSGSYYIKAKIDDEVNPEVWSFSSGKVTINHSPKITITAPNQNNNNADESFSITWTDQDNEENALISLYYDIDNFGNDGTLIALDIEEDESIDIFSWNTTNIPNGKYYIYAEISDRINPLYTNYSSVPLIVHHKMPNLRIQHVGTTPSEPKIGEKVIFNMTLINTGDKVAQNCVVELIIDDVLIGEIEVNEVLPDNGTYNAIFEPITVNSKVHSTIFRVKMDGEEVETQELTVVSQEKDELDLIFVLIPILLLIIIIILILVYLIRRKQLGDKTKDTQIESKDVHISCPSCSFSFNIPSEPRPLQIQCPNCGTRGSIK